MKIVKKAVAGTMESSDAMVFVEPGNNGREIELQSVVQTEYGDQMESVIKDVLDELGVDDIYIKIVDHGALDCVLSARIETAVLRGGGGKA